MMHATALPERLDEPGLFGAAVGAGGVRVTALRGLPRPGVRAMNGYWGSVGVDAGRGEDKPPRPP
ncbi:hypothetical protein, partial [Streptomyces sp. NPDC056921]|uniref:hypothetical protein n=1 Tax=Streptomyces sp. NPDC056921 TaxID=3345966 RepID=UPI0036303C6A